MNEVLRILVIGCGGILNKHLPALANLRDRARIVGLCDIDPTHIAAAISKYGPLFSQRGPEETRYSLNHLPTYTDYGTAIEELLPDVVYVLTPNASHAEIVFKALNAGCHVLCEKPMATTSQDAIQMFENALAAGRYLRIGYQNEYNEAAITMRQIVNDGLLGEIYEARAHAVRRGASPNWGSFQNLEAQGGGSVMDIGTHALQLIFGAIGLRRPTYGLGTLRYAMNSIKPMPNAWGDIPLGTQVEHGGNGFFVFEDGLEVHLETSWLRRCPPNEEREAVCTIYGTKACLEMKTDGSLWMYDTIAGKMRNGEIVTGTGGVAFYEADPLQANWMREAVAFYDAIDNNDSPASHLAVAVLVTQLLEGVYVSAKAHRPFKFNADGCPIPIAV